MAGHTSGEGKNDIDPFRSILKRIVLRYARPALVYNDYLNGLRPNKNVIVLELVNFTVVRTSVVTTGTFFFFY